MKRNETVFILLVGLFALLFAAVTLSQFGGVVFEKTPATVAGEGTAGKARDVDVEQIKRLINRGVLSDHESQFVNKAPELSQRKEPHPPAE